MKVEFKWEKPPAVVASGKTGGSKGLLFLANEVKRLSDPYVPADKLVLSQNVRVYVENGAGIVHYLSPYAHYQYQGVLYVDPVYGKGAFSNGEGRFWSRPGVAKKPTDKKLRHNTFRHPLATSQWDKAMMTARKGDLVKSFQNYIERNHL